MLRGICAAFLSISLLSGCVGVGAAENEGSGQGKLVLTCLNLPNQHGLAIVIQTPSGRNYMYDVGYRADFTIGAFMNENKINRLDGVIISHAHSDHCGSLPWLFDVLKVGALIDAGGGKWGMDEGYYKAVLKGVSQGVRHQVAAAGDKLDLDSELDVQVLAPPKEGIAKDDPNNNSLVLFIRHGKNAFLLPGDAASAEMDFLLKKWGEDKLKCDVLIAPHHGLAAEGDVEFAKATKPDVVIVPALCHYPDHLPNYPHHSPGKYILGLYGKAGSKVYVTAWQGSVQVISDGKSYAVKSEYPLPELPGSK